MFFFRNSAYSIGSDAIGTFLTVSQFMDKYKIMGRYLVHAFPSSGEYQANFWKLQILAPPGALFHYD